MHNGRQGKVHTEAGKERYKGRQERVATKVDKEEWYKGQRQARKGPKECKKRYNKAKLG
jgi:hypothetical protein